MSPPVSVSLPGSRPPKEIESVSFLFGDAIHTALEFHFRARLAGEPMPSLEDLLAAYDRRWKGVDPDSVQWRNESPDSLQELAHRILAQFLKSSAAKPPGRIIALEEELRAALIPGVPDLLGRIDLAVETVDALRIIDFKTSRCLWFAEQVTDASGQLLLYSQLATNLAPKPVLLSFVVLTKTRQPEVTVFDVPMDSSRLDRTLRIIKSVYQPICVGNFYPIPSAMNCSACSYQARCAAWCG